MQGLQRERHAQTNQTKPKQRHKSGVELGAGRGGKGGDRPFDDPVAVGGRGGVNGGVVVVHVAGGRGAAEGEGDGSDRPGGDHAPGEGCKGLEL